MVQSMSGKGNCYDNAVTEAFFKTLNTKWMYGKRYWNQQELRQSLFAYIEVCYNRKRLHSTLGYTTPAAFMQRYHQSICMASKEVLFLLQVQNGQTSTEFAAQSTEFSLKLLSM